MLLPVRGNSDNTMLTSGSPMRPRTDVANSVNRIEEIRQNLRQPPPKTLKKFGAHLRIGGASTSSRLDTAQTSPTTPDNRASLSNTLSYNENIENIPEGIVDIMSKSLSESNTFDTTTNKGDVFQMLKDVLSYFDLLDWNRQKSHEESMRLKAINTELSSMLKESNSRESRNYDELKKQRKAFVQWQESYSRLKTEAQTMITTVLEHREKLKEKLDTAHQELKRLSLENNQFQRAWRSEEQKSQNLQKYQELYITAEKEKRARESELDALLLEYSKVVNERNALESERNRVQGIVDEMEVERQLKTNSLDLSQLKERQNNNTLIATEESPFEQFSEGDAAMVLAEFGNLTDEQKQIQFSEIIDQLRQVTAEGEKYWGYTQFLMSELDNKGIQPMDCSLPDNDVMKND